MKYCLVKDGRAFEGDSAIDLVIQAADCYLNYEDRTMKLNGVEDTFSYSKEFSDAEFRAEAAKRALELLKRNGWRLYRGDWACQ